MRNTNAQAVKILRVERNCGCTSFNLGKYQLAPGEATKLTIDVDVPATYMRKFAGCVLKTDHPRFKDWSYTVEFVSLPFIVADPEVLNLGSLGADGRGVDGLKRITVDVFSGSKVELTRGMFAVPGDVELEVLPNPKVRRLEQGVWSTRYELSLGLSERGREAAIRSSRSGVTTRVITLTAPERGQWSYSVYWQTLALLACHASFLSFGNLSDENDDHSRTVIVTSTTNESFKIVSIKSQSPDGLIESIFDPSSEAVAQRLTIKARPRADSEKRFLTGSIQIRTTARIQPSVEVHWSATFDRSAKPGAKSDQRNLASRPSL